MCRRSAKGLKNCAALSIPLKFSLRNHRLLRDIGPCAFFCEINMRAPPIDDRRRGVGSYSRTSSRDDCHPPETRYNLNFLSPPQNLGFYQEIPNSHLYLNFSTSQAKVIHWLLFDHRTPLRLSSALNHQRPHAIAPFTSARYPSGGLISRSSFREVIDSCHRLRISLLMWASKSRATSLLPQCGKWSNSTRSSDLLLHAPHVP